MSSRPTILRRRGAAALFAALVLMMIPAAASAQTGSTYEGQLDSLNDSGASGDATVTIDGNTATVEVNSSGLLDGSPHAQHIHDLETAREECPTLDADGNGDDLINTAEGQPVYGPIQVSLTTKGDVSAKSALAVKRFPVGDVNYSRTFTLPDGVTADSLGDELAIVQHGVDLNGSGKYDGKAKSPLKAALPLEATIPATCGILTASQMGATPSGGVATGGGGTADGGFDMTWLVLALGALGLTVNLVVRSRRVAADM